MSTKLSTKEILQKRRLERMRLGQSVYELENLLSDPDIRVALVPLTEAEYENAIMESARIDVPDNLAGAQVRDRKIAHGTLLFACREPGDISKKMFDTIEEVTETLEQIDITHLMDCYFEMVDRSSPSLDGLGEEEIEFLKKALQEMDWNDLSGKQWYALKRSLMTLSPSPLGGKLPGSFSTNPLTMMNGEQESIDSASTNSTE